MRVSTAESDQKSRLPSWRKGLAVVWFGGLLAFGVAGRIDPELRVCQGTKVTTSVGPSIERSTDASGATAGTKVTTTDEAHQSTDSCAPVSVAELAALTLPGLFLIQPILKGINIAGLFGIDFKDIQEKATKAATEQTVRLVLTSERGSTSETASEQVAEQDFYDVPPA
jgi:hypothetical protein